MKATTEKVKYVGIDNWNRPIFKSMEHKNKYFGSVDRLFNYEATEQEVLSRIDESDLCYFGSFFGCEPMGTPANNVTIVKGAIKK